jgi:inorganic pyrophosphatase
MSDDPGELPPSASRRSFLAGVGGLTGMTAIGRAEAATTVDEQHPSDDAAEHDSTPMNLVDDLDQHSDFPETMKAVSVAQMNTREKYEYRQDIPGIILDRVLYSEVRYPGDYGFIPQTAGGDGDPLDVLILLESSLFPGCVLDVRPVTVIEMTDTGETDDKIIGVPADDPRFDHITSTEDIPEHHREEIAEFFRTYKNLEPEGNMVIEGYKDKETAHELLTEAHQNWNRTSKKQKGKDC